MKRLTDFSGLILPLGPLKILTDFLLLVQVAQQEAEKARFLVEMAEQHKKAAVIAAEGDTEAAELLAKALGKAGEGLVELRRVIFACQPGSLMG